MNFSRRVLREDEKAIYGLRELYSKYGYSHYRVSKFEEYDLYAKNRSFLVSENLLTFTDTNGKLMALKPDVTLSIIKNALASESGSYKLYYDEHVYRTTVGGDGFREIRQAGLESIGCIDLFAESEVLFLAMRSLCSISEDFLLDLSHMRFIEGLLENMGVRSEDMSELLSLIGSKNTSGLRALCSSYGVSEADCDALCSLTAMYMPIEKALPEIKPLVRGEKMQSAYSELEAIYEAMTCYGATDRLYLDFSVVNDMSYYDGIIFKGFINKIPESILSGGRYDRLMEKFGKSVGAIGFAIYLDRLERLESEDDGYDVDVMLVYDADAAPKDIIAAARELSAYGSVRALRSAEGGVRYRKLARLDKEGRISLETND